MIGQILQCLSIYVKIVIKVFRNAAKQLQVAVKEVATLDWTYWPFFTKINILSSENVDFSVLIITNSQTQIISDEPNAH